MTAKRASARRPERRINEAVLFDETLRGLLVPYIRCSYCTYIVLEHRALFAVFVLVAGNTAAHLIWPRDQFVYQYRWLHAGSLVMLPLGRFYLYICSYPRIRMSDKFACLSTRVGIL